jgi:hypothetical protein
VWGVSIRVKGVMREHRNERAIRRLNVSVPPRLSMIRKNNAAPPFLSHPFSRVLHFVQIAVR